MYRADELLPIENPAVTFEGGLGSEVFLALKNIHLSSSYSDSKKLSLTDSELVSLSYSLLHNH